LARRLLRDVAPTAEILTISGSSEALVPGIADACLDLVETGTSAGLNALAIRQTFASPCAARWQILRLAWSSMAR
jgi:ATP phosphoribosyltransferase